VNDNDIYINISCCQVKTKFRLYGQRLLHSRLLSADNLKYVFNKTLQDINYLDRLSIREMVLDLGKIPATQFEIQFNDRLAQAFAYSLLQESKNVPSQPEGLRSECCPASVSSQPEEPELFSQAVSCLQPAGPQSVLAHRGKQQQLLLLRQWLAAMEQLQIPAIFYLRASPSCLALAATGYLLNNAQGLRFLTSHHPPPRQINNWAEAVANGEISPELVVQLMLYPQSGQQHEAACHWLLPLWQKKVVRDAVSRHAGRATALEIDARFRPILQRSDWQHSQNIEEQSPLAYPLSNAGIVILWPLLPQLFSLLELCKEGTFIRNSARWQAVACLDWLVWGEEPPVRERLRVGQLLCGIPLDTLSAEWAPLTAQQCQLIEAWLSAVGQQLPAWQKLSLADIRQLFLRRPGEIYPDTQPPQIVVRSESFDYLLRDWPWPLTVAQFPWLEQPLPLIWPLPHLTG